MIDCVSDSEPLVSTTNTRSPGWTNVCIFRTVFTWSYPALERESDAMIRPCFVMIPRQ
jgi:hypothetical protein